MLRRFVAGTRIFPFPDYDLEILDGREEPKLSMKFRTPSPELTAKPN
jgi:hypothetical protein